MINSFELFKVMSPFIMLVFRQIHQLDKWPALCPFVSLCCPAWRPRLSDLEWLSLLLAVLLCACAELAVWVSWHPPCSFMAQMTVPGLVGNIRKDRAAVVQAAARAVCSRFPRALIASWASIVSKHVLYNRQTSINYSYNLGSYNILINWDPDLSCSNREC